MIKPFASAALVLLLTGCAQEFALPEGDAAAGRDAFVSLGCNACHTVGDIERADSDIEPPIDKRLGGEVTRVRTYQDLVTSIINPTHRVSASYRERRFAELVDEQGESRMPIYNDIMTVQQLVDIVTFLRPHYQVAVPRRDYPLYYP